MTSTVTRLDLRGMFPLPRTARKMRWSSSGGSVSRGKASGSDVASSDVVSLASAVGVDAMVRCLTLCNVVEVCENVRFRESLSPAQYVGYGIVRTERDHELQDPRSARGSVRLKLVLFTFFGSVQQAVMGRCLSRLLFYLATHCRLLQRETFHLRMEYLHAVWLLSNVPEPAPTRAEQCRAILPLITSSSTALIEAEQLLHACSRLPALV